MCVCKIFLQKKRTRREERTEKGPTVETGGQWSKSGQPSLQSFLVLKALLATRTIIFFLSLITSLITSRTSQPCLQAFIFGKRIPCDYTSPQLIPILKASVSHSSSSSLDRERVCVCPTQSVCFFSSSSYNNNTSFSKSDFSFLFPFVSSRLLSAGT